ncbi:hypothetical protein G6F46_005580 [Rhizopus delemar]|uniref:Uncharacterized protein n=2 Tax=Rhizopus TaxID=4842 RepID=A0A9P6Z5E5_9FUNG|nr:hypothetical protein G6F43_000610 [Rhizopus delemar]KAG1545152.1 hypothetical protein G6F51_005636 [Rhizopus arrhizus]KAG1463656.1 hypothetical protein G6F55_002257 [Rhizopus delemar]KAG1498833.1 hypothetical protein G6F54_004804 [Rhizopus delemar]KAG1512524.1 hypothetical protein G6F53_005124 [Rhizopus delemar]
MTRKLSLLFTTTHTSAFNTIHIIAAVLGIIGAVVVGLKKQNTTRNRFADDFETIETPTPAIIHHSPIMQQHQLQQQLQLEIPKACHCSTSTSSTSPLIIPPPPYHP